MNLKVCRSTKRKKLFTNFNFETTYYAGISNNFTHDVKRVVVNIMIKRKNFFIFLCFDAGII